MKVWVIRHGESETNRDGLWTGWMDVALTEKGKQDAAMAGEYLKKVTFDKIYTSDLQRAKNTAQIAIPGCKYETNAALREVNVGNIAGKPLSIVREGCTIPKNINGYADFGGESFDQMDARVAQFMKQIETADGENVAIFTHAGWVRSSLDFVMGMKMPKKHICCNNCTIAIYEYTGTMWKLHSWINL